MPQGWTIATQIKPSLIPGAGNGRFTSEPVAAKTIVAVKKTLAVGDIHDATDRIPPDVTLTFASTACIEQYLALNAADHPRSEVLNEIAHFMWSLDGEKSYLNASTWTMNHADSVDDGLNIEHTVERLEDGSTAVVSRAMHDLAADVELKNNYRDFVIPDFYLGFCAEHGFKDVRSAVLEVVDGVCA